MSKDLWLRAHGRLVEEYMDEYPNADWLEAYDWATEHADARAADIIAAMADYAKGIAKEGK